MLIEPNQLGNIALCGRGSQMTRMVVYCRVCGVECDTWPSKLNRSGRVRGTCDNCRDKHGVPIPEYKHCQLCKTDFSPQWRQFRKMHVCNACGVKMYRHHESEYYRHVKRGKRPTQRNKSWGTSMARKLMQPDWKQKFGEEE